MSDYQAAAPQTAGGFGDGIEAKRPWHTPRLEEIDYAATEFAGPLAPEGVDAVTGYQS